MARTLLVRAKRERKIIVLLANMLEVIDRWQVVGGKVGEVCYWKDAK